MVYKGVKRGLSLVLLIMFIVATSCKKSELSDLQKKINEYNQGNKGLKDYYTPESFFYMGAAISPSLIDNPAKVALIKRHFNSVTAENAMKWSSLQPVEGVFNFTDADKIVAFAQSNGIRVRGHCLCWHNQVPSWVFKDGTATASKELVLQRLRTHITTVLNHFKGKVYAWDVVNEAIDDGSNVYRASQWYTICGEDFILEAFKTARAADPDIKLFYNDYSAEDNVKRDKIYNLLAKLKAQNIVDGMGLQGHWNMSYPSVSLITDAFNKYMSLGIELQITEMDVSVYSSNSSPESKYTDQIAGLQTAAYKRYFDLFRTFKDNLTGVTFWGVADDNTWLDNFPVAGRKNYPLLFNENLEPKPAYFEVIDFK